MRTRRILRWLAGAAIAFAVVVLLNIIAFAVVLARDPLPADAAPNARPALRELPLVERVPVRVPASAPLVIYYTGDNGWQDGDLAFTRGLNGFGAPVVVIDSLHYFSLLRSGTARPMRRRTSGV